MMRNSICKIFLRKKQFLLRRKINTWFRKSLLYPHCSKTAYPKFDSTFNKKKRLYFLFTVKHNIKVSALPVPVDVAGGAAGGSGAGRRTSRLSKLSSTEVDEDEKIDLSDLQLLMRYESSR